MIAEAKRHNVLPALHYGRAQIVEARIDQTLFVLRKLNANDVAWLRKNEPEILRAKVARLGAGLVELVEQIGDGSMSNEAEKEQLNKGFERSADIILRANQSP